MKGTKGSRNPDQVDVLFSGDLVAICQQGCRSTRHDLVLVGGDNPPLEVEVGWQFGESHSSQDGNMKVFVNDVDGALPLVFPNAAKLVEPEAFRLGNKWEKDGNQTIKVINSLEVINYNAINHELPLRNNMRFNY